MREILFKAKRKDNGEWVEGYLSDNGFDGEEKKYFISGLIIEKCNGTACDEWDITGIDFYDYEIDPETICQFTGLCDKNGKKIWENDIVSNEWCFSRGKSIVKFGEHKDYHMPERYQCGNYGFFLEHMHQNDFGVRKDILYFSCKCEVVGNIFDNPDLLEV